MQRFLCRSLFIVGIFLPFGVTAVAGPLDLKQVASDAKAVVHLDFDAMRDSLFVQKAMQRHMERHKHAEAKMKFAEQLLGMDPRKDLHGATLYTSEIGKHSGVLILHAKLNRERLDSWAEKLPNRKTTEHGSYKISIWSKEHKGKTYEVASTWYGDDRLVVASGVDQLKSALDVLDGKKDGVGEDHALGGAIAKGATVVVRATDLQEADLPRKKPLAKQLKSLRLVMGEDDGQSFFRARATAIDEQTAGQMKDVAEGAKALGQLCSIGNDQKRQLVDALRINSEGDTVTVRWNGSAEVVFAQFEKACQKWEAKLAKMKKHRHGKDCPKCDGKKCDKCDGDKCPKCDGKKCEKCDGKKCDKCDSKKCPKCEKEGKRCEECEKKAKEKQSDKKDSADEKEPI